MIAISGSFETGKPTFHRRSQADVCGLREIVLYFGAGGLVGFGPDGFCGEEPAAEEGACWFVSSGVVDAFDMICIEWMRVVDRVQRGTGPGWGTYS